MARYCGNQNSAPLIRVAQAFQASCKNTALDIESLSGNR